MSSSPQRHEMQPRLVTGSLSPSLLFQFLVVYWLDIAPHLETLQSLQNNLKPAALRKLKGTLTLLLPPLKAEGMAFPWHTSPGSLGRLHTFCTPPGESSHPATAKIARWQRQLAKAMTLLSEALHLLEETGNRIDNAAQQQRLQKLLEQGLTCLRRFALSLVNAFPLFRDDENVVYFLLRHAPEIDAHMEPGFVHQLLGTMFDSKSSYLVDFLTQRYKARGFSLLSPRFSSSFDSLTRTL